MAVHEHADPLVSTAYRGDREVACVPAGNRGLAYGDGLFETMRAHAGTLPWFDRHWSRLAVGARRLAIPLPPRGLVEQALARALAQAPGAGVAKLLLTRGEGGRGYAPPVDPVPTWIVSAHRPAPPSTPLRMVRCQTRLALQPLLAGIKHCNRLEQVLARAEVDAAGADEGLLCDTGGMPVAAVAGNLLVQLDGHWCTPPVDQCGVAGVLRGWLLEAGLVEERRLHAADLDRAPAVAVCNAVRGILAVRQLDARAWATAAAIEPLRAALARAHPAFARELQ